MPERATQRPRPIRARRATAAARIPPPMAPLRDNAQATRKPLLADQAYEMIKAKILSLELGPGQFVNELAIAQMLGVGRTPVHQAAHRLAAEGLLEIIPRKGILIRPDSMNEVLTLLEARLAVEPGIAALAAQRVTDAQIEEIRGLLAKSAKITDQRYRPQFMAVDRAFHALIATGAGNRILAETIRPMHERSTRIWQLRVWQENDLELTQQEHEAILDAILARDGRAAARAMRAHLLSLQRRITRGRVKAEAVGAAG